MKDLSDEKLISLAIQGSESAWKEIYRRYHGRVKRIVGWQKWHFRYAEVEEVTQEVFMELIKALPNFRGEASLNTFLTRLCKNKCISVLRRNKALKRAREEYGFIFDDRKDEGEDMKKIFVESDMGRPEESLLFEEEAGELMKAMQQLSPECREIVKKRFFQDMSYKELCDDLELPLGTVCSRLKRCLTRLKEIFEQKFGKV